MKNRIITCVMFFIGVMSAFAFLLFVCSCDTNADVSSNSFQRFNYVYIISEDRYVEISSWFIGDYGTLMFVDKNGCHYCICQSNWILYESI